MSDRRGVVIVSLSLAVLLSAGFGSKRLQRGDFTLAAAFGIAGVLLVVLVGLSVTARRR